MHLKRVHDTSQLNMEVELSYNNWDFLHSLEILNMDNFTKKLKYQRSRLFLRLIGGKLSLLHVALRLNREQSILLLCWPFSLQ